MITALAPAVEYHVVNSLGWPDLRPLQKAAVEPVRRGDDCLLLAPTAGGKTEAAFFPVLSEMTDGGWQGLSVLYVTPLRALLNNLHPRLESYAAWVGRRVGLWHGDVGPSQRARMLADPPDVLLTTPESLEAMLVSTKVDHEHLFANLRAVVVDELHAFAGDDRGWHLLAVLERLQHLAGRRLQRIGLTATVGNPEQLLGWLAGGSAPERSSVVSPDVGTAASPPDLTLDYVGSVKNAAYVVSALHKGEKRLVFCESRAQAEEMAQELRRRDVQTFVSHSSLSADERRRSEAAFAEARDCVVVATSTLELGIDVGDLDRVIQLDSPTTVASFLQRLGRTGRRAGSSRNMLFLATREQNFLQAAGLLTLWGRGHVEPVIPPPHPRHIVAQQLLALVLQEGRIGRATWRDWWGDAPVMAEAEQVLHYLVGIGFLAADGDFLHMGPMGEREFGHRHFMELTAVFSAPPEFQVMHGRLPLGSVSPTLLTLQLPEGQPRVISLSGRPWLVTHVDWRRRQVHVVEDRGAGRSIWQGGIIVISAELAGAMRDVLLGVDPPVELSRRAASLLAELRSGEESAVSEGGLVLHRRAPLDELWTWAGTRANTSIVAALAEQGVPARADAYSVRAESLDVDRLRLAAQLLGDVDPPAPTIEQKAMEGLKFSSALPEHLAVATIAERTTDPLRAAAVLRQRIEVRGLGQES